MGMTTEPCRLCQTAEGYIRPGTSEPARTRNLCEACYIRERRAGRLDRWPNKGPRPANPTPHTCRTCEATFYAYASQGRTYCSRRCYHNAEHATRPLVMPTGIITPAMLGITAREIAARCEAAALELAESTEDALIYAEYWRVRRPEQFTPAAVAALYPDPAGLACSAWADEAAQRAA